MPNSRLKVLVLRYIESEGSDFVSYSEGALFSQSLSAKHLVESVS